LSRFPGNPLHVQGRTLALAGLAADTAICGGAVSFGSRSSQTIGGLFEFCTESYVSGQGANDQMGNVEYDSFQSTHISFRGLIMNRALAESAYILDQDEAFQSPGEKTSSGDPSLEPQSTLKNSQVVKTAVSIIADNTFFRTCLARCLETLAAEFVVNVYEDVDGWRQAPDRPSAAIVLLCATGQKATDAVVQQGLDTIMAASSGARVIVISDIEHPSQMVAALQRGARGYVPMSLDLEIAIGAINLVNVGGTFIPASSLLSLRGANASSTETPVRKRVPDLLTERQLTVLEILRKGDPNKIIAHKLIMSEATVKIHVRNMMKKIHAKNRTELVCMTSELF